METPKCPLCVVLGHEEACRAWNTNKQVWSPKKYLKIWMKDNPFLQNSWNIPLRRLKKTQSEAEEAQLLGDEPDDKPVELPPTNLKVVDQPKKNPKKKKRVKLLWVGMNVKMLKTMIFKVYHLYLKRILRVQILPHLTSHEVPYLMLEY